MADKPIGQLPVSVGLDDNSLLVTEQGGEARSITGALVKQFAKDAVAEDVSRAEQAAKDATEAKTSVDTAKDAIDQTKADIDQTKAAIDGIKTDIDTAKDAINQAQTDVAKNKTDAEAAAQSAGTSAAIAAENAGRVAAALEEADGIVEEVTGLRDEALNTVKSAVLFTEQTLTAAQKEQARANIGSFFDKGPSGTVKWDGVTSNLVSITANEEPELNYAGETYYLMPRTSSKVPSAASLDALGGSYTYQTGLEDMGENGIVPELGTVRFGAGNGNLNSTSYPGATIVGDMVIVVHEAGTELYNITVEKPGVYFRKYWQSPNFYQTQVTEMTLTGGTLDDGLERLPKKFLPEGVAFESYVNEKTAPIVVTVTDNEANMTMIDLVTASQNGAEVKLRIMGDDKWYSLARMEETEEERYNSRGELLYSYPAARAYFTSNVGNVTYTVQLYGRIDHVDTYGTLEKSSIMSPLDSNGGTLYGDVTFAYGNQLTLGGAPTEDLHAATKQYVDEKATWENLQGKPTIFEGGDTLTWDGDTTGLVSAEGVVFKVSGLTPTIDDFANGATLKFSGEISGSTVMDIPAANIVDLSSDGVPVIIVGDSGLCFVAFQDNVTNFDIPLPEKGIYFMKPSEDVYVTALTIPGYTGFGKEVIDPDVLPESVKGGAGGVVVTFTFNEDETISADKTYAEIVELLHSGVIVTGKLDAGGLILYLSPAIEAGSGSIQFSCLIHGGNFVFYAITYDSNNIGQLAEIPFSATT